MFKKLTDWIFRHYLQDQYIRKTEIQAVLQKARQDEAALQTQQFQTEMNRLEETLKNEKMLMEESLQSEIIRLNSFVTTAVKKTKRADETYYQSVKALRRNRQMTGDVTEKLKELMGLLGVLFGAIEDIERNIGDELQQIEYKG